MYNLASERKGDQNSKTFDLLNDRYELQRTLGKGFTSQVFLGRDLKLPSKQKIAVKIYSDEFLYKQEGIKTYLKEIEILRELNHPNIVNMYSNGRNGTVKHENRVIMRNLTFTSLEYVPGASLFDICIKMGAMKE